MSTNDFREKSRGVSKERSADKPNSNNKIADENSAKTILEEQKSFSGNLTKLTTKPIDQGKKSTSFDASFNQANKLSTTSQSLFEQFCQESSLKNQLIELAESWLETISSQRVSYLQLDNRWHYLDKRKKSGYKGTFTINIDSIPYIRLTYNDFGHGGYSESFDSSQALSILYQDWKLYHLSIPNLSSIKTNSKATSKASSDNNSSLSTNNPTEQSNQQQYLESLKSLKSLKPLRSSLRATELAFREAREQQAKKESLEQTHILWNSLPSIGESKYLINKGLANINELSVSIRYGKDFILAQIVDINGQVKGYQQIFDDGTKKLTFGSEKRSNFILLGELLGNISSKQNRYKPSKKHPKTIFITEGLATGLTIKLAKDNCLVICTIDAGNIMSVVAELRAKFGGSRVCKIIICADNDQWKADNPHPTTKLPIGNTGLIRANKVALKHRCLVATPNFDMLDTSKNPTDFNDLLQLTNLAEVKRQLKLATKANPQFAFARASTVEQTRLNRLFSNRHHKTITINDRFIKHYTDEQDKEHNSIKLLTEVMASEKVILLRSGTGTGKTELIRNFIKQNKDYSSLYISPRIALTGNAAVRLDSEFYLDYKGSISNQAQLQQLQHVAIVVNSLPMLIDPNTGLLRQFDIIVIDEIEQLLRHLMGKIKNKKLVLELFYTLIRQAKHIIVADAHLSNVTLEFLSELRPRESFLTVLNHYQVGLGKKVILYDSPGKVEMACLTELANNGNVYITFNCKKAARQFYNKIKAFYQAKAKDNNKSTSIPLPILYISGDNNGDDEVKAFFSNPNIEALKYRLIISTPSLSTGVSIDVDHFTLVAGIFSHTVNTSQDCQQSLARPRAANTWHVYISDSKQSFPTDKETISAKWTTTHPYDQYQLRKQLGSNTLYGVNDPIYENLCLNVEINRAFLVNDFLTNFVKELAIAGYEVKYNHDNEIQTFASDYFTKVGKVLEQQEYVSSVSNSIDLNKIEAQTIAQKGSTTLGEKRALEKFIIKEFYRLGDCADDKELSHFIDKDERGVLRQRIMKLEIAMSTDSQILKRYEDQQLAGIELIPDMRLYLTERELISKTLVFLGINSKTLEYNGELYSSQSLKDKGFVTWIEENRKEFSGIINIPRKEVLENEPLRFVSKLLKQVGLKQKRTGKASNGLYKIDEQQLAFIKTIIAKRSMACLIDRLAIGELSID